MSNQMYEVNNKEYIKLSVVVPVYNVKKYLDDCLRSLAEQSIQNVEFIIVDDGSTDGSSEICDYWSNHDKRFIIIHQENKGTLLARKTGILKSKGERIIFLDGDDMLARGALQQIFQLIENCNADVIQFSFMPFNDISKKQYNDIKKYAHNHKMYVEKNVNIAKLIFIDKIIMWNIWNKIYCSKILKETCKYIYDYKLTSAEDVYHSFLISYFTNTFYSYKTTPIYLYRFNTGISTKKQNLSTFIGHVEYYKIIFFLKNFLQKVQATHNWYKYLDEVKKNLYSSLIYIMESLPRSDLNKAFKLFYNKYDIIYCLPWIEQCFIGRQNELALAYRYSQQKKLNKNISNTIGIFYHRYYNGGVERVISYQIPIFIKLGYRVVLFTEEINEKLEYPLPSNIIRIQLPVSYTQNRADIFLSAIKKYNISIVCHHATSSLWLLFDLIFLHEAGVHIILTEHEATSFSIARNDGYPFDRVSVYKLANILITLSASEEHFYQQCGVNAHYIPNPIIDIDISDFIPISKRDPTVLWIGRLENKQKNYKDALNIFKKIITHNKKIICYIVGSGSIKDNIYVKLFIKFHRLEKNIIHIPYTKDVELFYKKASVQLITSSFESFGLVISECKLYKLPLVTYDLPIVELLKDGKGYISIERHNIQGAADAVLQIIDNNILAEHLSKEARESIEPFIHFDQENAWSVVLSNPTRQYAIIREEDANNMSLFWTDLISMYHNGLAARPSIKQKLKNLLIKLKYLIKLILNPILPQGSKRRITAVKTYHFVKYYLKIKCRDLVNNLSLRTK